MSNPSVTCYTLEAALDKAIDLENRVFQQFIGSIRTVKHLGAREVLKEAAAEELEHKQYLEKVLIDGELETGGIDQSVPTMDFDQLFGVEKLSADADTRSALAHAIHLINTSVHFYDVMTEACRGAPMTAVFQKIGNEQRQHLQKLEDSYEEHFLTEN